MKKLIAFIMLIAVAIALFVFPSATFAAAPTITSVSTNGSPAILFEVFDGEYWGATTSSTVTVTTVINIAEAGDEYAFTCDFMMGSFMGEDPYVFDTINATKVSPTQFQCEITTSALAYDDYWYFINYIYDNDGNLYDDYEGMSNYYLIAKDTTGPDMELYSDLYSYDGVDYIDIYGSSFDGTYVDLSNYTLSYQVNGGSWVDLTGVCPNYDFGYGAIYIGYETPCQIEITETSPTGEYLFVFKSQDILGNSSSVFSSVIVENEGEVEPPPPPPPPPTPEPEPDPEPVPVVTPPPAPTPAPVAAPVEEVVAEEDDSDVEETEEEGDVLSEEDDANENENENESENNDEDTDDSKDEESKWYTSGWFIGGISLLGLILMIVGGVILYKKYGAAILKKRSSDEDEE